MKPKIRYVNYGLANTFDNDKEKWIELNKNLKKYPTLYKDILKHELQHLRSKNKYIDIMIELKEIFNTKKQREITKFMRENPRAYTQLIPFVWNKKGFFPDYFMLGSYVILVIIFMILIRMVI